MIGTAVSQLVNRGLLHAADGDHRGELLGVEAWRVVLGVMIVHAVLYGLLSFAIPESPRFPIWAGRIAEPDQSLSRGSTCSANSRRLRQPSSTGIPPHSGCSTSAAAGSVLASAKATHSSGVTTR